MTLDAAGSLILATMLVLAVLTLSQNTASVPVRSTPPVVEVALETSVQGTFLAARSEVQKLVLSALENAGIREGVRFVSRDFDGNRAGVTDRDRSGFFEGSGHIKERGAFVRPTHRLQVSYVMERSVDSRSGKAVFSGILGGTPPQGVASNARRVTEAVLVKIRGNLFDARQAVSSAAIPTVEARAESDLVTSGTTQIFHKDVLRVWIFQVPVKVVDHEVGTSRLSSPKGLELTMVTLDRASESFAKELRQVLPEMVPVPVGEQPGLFVESIDQERQSVTIGGEIRSLRRGQILSVPLIPMRGEPRVGEETHAYIKVVRIGDELASAVVVDGPDGAKRARIRSGLVIDRRRAIRKA